MRRATASVCLAMLMMFLVAGTSRAQDVSSNTVTKDFEVIAVNGNTLDVQLPEGPRELTVPDEFRFMVDGRPLSVHELMPGMKGTATITTTTTTTPVTVTEVKNGEVVLAGGGMISVRTDGTIKQFSQADIEKRGIKLTRDGRPAQVSEFRTGDRLSATIITEQPPTVLTERDVQATLERPAATTAAAPPAAVDTTPAPEPARTAGTTGTSESSTRSLPHTASGMPALALVGMTALAAAAILATRRRRRTV